MSKNDKIIPYLSDEELDRLIMDIENEEPVQAPAGIERNVLSFIEHKKRIKTAEFGRYCVRVGFAVAAAIALVLIVPFIPDTKAVIPTREDAVMDRTVISRDEVLKSKTVMTKQEALSEKSNTGYLLETEEFIKSHIQSLIK